MSHGARSLYVALKRRYSSNRKNNGRIYLSIRAARKELGSGSSQIIRWFRELQHYGFIVSSKNSKANRIETGERSGGIGEICSVEVDEK
jgi:hypothetical protein